MSDQHPTDQRRIAWSAPVLTELDTRETEMFANPGDDGNGFATGS